MKAYIYLAVAIASEVMATSALKASEGFTNWLPSVITVLGYAISFYCLATVLRSIPVGVAYAIWSGAGIVLVALVGLFFFKQPLDWPAVVGMALIITGIVVMQLFSKAAA